MPYIQTRCKLPDKITAGHKELEASRPARNGPRLLALSFPNGPMNRRLGPLSIPTSTLHRALHLHLNPHPTQHSTTQCATTLAAGPAGQPGKADGGAVQPRGQDAGAAAPSAGGRGGEAAALGLGPSAGRPARAARARRQTWHYRSALSRLACLAAPARSAAAAQVPRGALPSAALAPRRAKRGRALVFKASSPPTRAPAGPLRAGHLCPAEAPDPGAPGRGGGRGDAAYAPPLQARGDLQARCHQGGSRPDGPAPLPQARGPTVRCQPAPPRRQPGFAAAARRAAATAGRSARWQAV